MKFKKVTIDNIEVGDTLKADLFNKIADNPNMFIKCKRCKHWRDLYVVVTLERYDNVVKEGSKEYNDNLLMAFKKVYGE